jgi:hypothetical protein
LPDLELVSVTCAPYLACQPPQAGAQASALLRTPALLRAKLRYRQWQRSGHAVSNKGCCCQNSKQLRHLRNAVRGFRLPHLQESV